MSEHIRTALIIDDEPAICFLLEQILKMKKIKSFKAESIKAARVLLTQLSPDIIFVDHRLPDGFGLHFIPAMKKLCPDTKIVAMTAQEFFDKDIIDSFGADYFLAKPFAINIVQNLIDSFYNKYNLI